MTGVFILEEDTKNIQSSEESVVSNVPCGLGHTPRDKEAPLFKDGSVRLQACSGISLSSCVHRAAQCIQYGCAALSFH